MSEHLVRRELPITPRSLLMDNHSQKSQILRSQWDDMKRQNWLTATDSCSDARVSMTTALGMPGIISLRSIASAHMRPDNDPFNWVYTHPSVARAVVFEHFDGENLAMGQIPAGCGGLTEKKKIERKSMRTSDIKTALDFVMARIVHEDLAVQAIASASRVAAQTKVPVLAAAIDHRTYQMYPLAQFLGDSFISPIKLGDILDYNPERIYANGIPYMDLSNSPGPFESIVRANLAQQEMLMQDPTFSERQKVQNPKTVIISTEIRPAGIRYPGHFGDPNTAFIVRLPYNKRGGLHVDGAELSEAIAQANYALSHSTTAASGKPFEATANLLIETPDLGLTKEIAAEALRDETIRAWKTAKNAQVLGAQVNSTGVSGEVTKIETL